VETAGSRGALAHPAEDYRRTEVSHFGRDGARRALAADSLGGGLPDLLVISGAAYEPSGHEMASLVEERALALLSGLAEVPREDAPRRRAETS
jgi:hypothetical protein